MTTFPHLTWAHSLIVSQQPWDAGYWNVVAAVRSLPGTVVCPEDPTIPLYAKQYAGQNIFSEKDARAQNGSWPRSTPEPVLSELRAADYVVDVANYWGENVNEIMLENLGFEPVRHASLDPECYRIWRSKNVGLAGSAGRTALESE
jgi:hypothetical protein